MRVEGVDMGTRSPTWASEVVANFAPVASVPILDRHGGRLIGYLDALEAEGPNLRFRGAVEDGPALMARLAAGYGVSIEAAENGEPYAPGKRPRRPGTSGDARSLAPISEMAPHFRGRFHPGWNLVGVALSEHPASPGSLMWLDTQPIDDERNPPRPPAGCLPTGGPHPSEGGKR